MAGREIDDVYHRIQAKDSYKNTQFDHKRTTTDVYTGEKIFYGNRNESLYQHPLEKVADIDHITPIAVIKDRYGDLSIEQQRIIANSTYNYAITNAQINRIGKNSLENHEYIANECGKIYDTLKTGDVQGAINQTGKVANEASRMLPAEAYSRVRMSAEASYMRLGNAVERLSPELSRAGRHFQHGAQEALAASVIPMTAVAVQNLYHVAAGDMDLDDAAKQVAGLTVEIAVAGGTREVMVNGVSALLKQSGNSTLRRLAGSNELTQIIVLGLIVKDSALQYLDGTIDGKRFIEQVQEQGAILMAGTIGASIGATIGTVLLPGVGTVVGEVIGSLVMTVACSTIISAVQTARHLDDYRIQDAHIRRIQQEALAEMSQQRQHLKAVYEREYQHWDEEISGGFDLILRSACTEAYDLEGITTGLDQILQLFGKHVAFKNLQEYEGQLDDVLVLHIGRK